MTETSGRAAGAAFGNAPTSETASGLVGDGDGARPADRLWWVALVVYGAVIGLYGLVPEGLPRDVVYLVVGLSVTVAITVGVRRHRPVVVIPWALMAVGQLIWVVGDTTYSWQHDVLGSTASPAPADVFYLLAYPVFAAAMLVLVRRRQRGRDVGGFLDSLLVTTGLALLVYELLVRPALEGGPRSVLGDAVTLAYPLGDLLLLGAVIRLLVAPGAWVLSVRILLFAVVMLVGADLVATGFLLYADGVDDTPWWVDYLWLTSYGAWAVAALHPSMRVVTLRSDETQPKFGAFRLAMLALSVLIAPGTLVVQQLRGLPTNVWPVVVGSALLFGLVIARMDVAMRQISRISQERELLQAELAFEAGHDSLTRLPNRAQGMTIMGSALARSHRSGIALGLLFVDLDGFKHVNDSMGHGAGDELLRRVAARLQASVRGGDTVVRHGGDEFVVILEEIVDERAALCVAQRLVDVVAEPVQLTGVGTAQVGASIGVVVCDVEELDPEVLLGQADAAAYRAKSSGRGQAVVFDGSFRSELAEHASLAVALASAVRDGELVLEFEPVAAVADGSLRGFQARPRWERPGGEVVDRHRFLAVAESSDLACDIGRWVLASAAAHLVAWAAAGDTLTMTVAVSPRHAASNHLVDDVGAALSGSGLAPDRLVLEVAEGVLTGRNRAVSNLRMVRKLGVRVGVAGFGAGYTSVARLNELPVDAVKFDQGTLDRGAGSSPVILQLMLQAVHSVGLSAVVEGVERTDQLAALQAVSCDRAQGRRLGGAMTADEVVARLDGRAEGETSFRAVFSD